MTDIGETMIRRLRKFSEGLEEPREVVVTQSSVLRPFFMVSLGLWASVPVSLVVGGKPWMLWWLALLAVVSTIALWFAWMHFWRTNPELLKTRKFKATILPGVRVTKIIVNTEDGTYKSITVDADGYMTSRTKPLPPDVDFDAE